MMLTCDLLAWEERQEEEDRTIGDPFHIMGEVMPDLELNEVLVWFIQILKQLIEHGSLVPARLLQENVTQFISKLPQGVSERLKAA